MTLRLVVLADLPIATRGTRLARPTAMFSRSSTLAAIVAATFAVAPEAEARNGGIAADGCDGCHNGGKVPTITLDVSPSAPKPGESVTVTVTIPAVNGGAGGLYLRTNGKGSLATIDGQSTRLIDIGQLVHSAPKAPSGSSVQFQSKWTAPMTPGGVTLSVWGVAANSDRGSKGDGASWASKSFAVGCTGKTYYRDWDGDGFGGEEILVDCSKPAGYVENHDDCDDNDPKVFPGAPELCNMRDDNCNGEVDENLVVTTHYEDKDGDGYGMSSGKTVTAKCPPPGYAPRPGDCDDNDPKVHPNVVEVCNHHDDNCDGRVDERVRPICGVGMCARAAPTCEPGQPKPEKCNGLDDDCNGEVDDGDGLCPEGQTCYQTECVPSASVPADAGGDAGGGATGSTDGGCAMGRAGETSGCAIALLLLVAGRRRRSRG